MLSLVVSTDPASPREVGDKRRISERKNETGRCRQLSAYLRHSGWRGRLVDAVLQPLECSPLPTTKKGEFDTAAHCTAGSRVYIVVCRVPRCPGPFIRRMRRAGDDLRPHRRECVVWRANCAERIENSPGSPRVRPVISPDLRPTLFAYALAPSRQCRRPVASETKDCLLRRPLLLTSALALIK